MSEPTGDHPTVAPAPTPAPAPAGHAAEKPQLADLMANGPKGDTAKPAAELDAEARRAAEQALAEGERALAAARAQLAGQVKSEVNRGRNGKELALRFLLVANVVAMFVVAMLPTPKQSQPSVPPPSTTHAPVTEKPRPLVRNDDKYMQAMAAAGAPTPNYPKAIGLLEEHLAESPNMSASARTSAMLALEYYQSQVGNLSAAQEYRRRIEALKNSHSLPDDLVVMAEAAAKSGDQESLRRIWARFLLQQRQIPPALYKHIAAAYLQLGDSYRSQANAAAERERQRELEANAARLRDELTGKEDGK